MEENKNNAIEKTEEIADKSKKTQQNKSKKRATNKKKTNTKADIREKKAEKKRNIKLQKQKDKQEKKQAKKDAKLEKQKNRKLLKNKNKKKRKSILAEKKQQKLQRREELEALKLQKREERAKRRDLLKHESKLDRKKRIAKEKQEKINLRKQRLEDRKNKNQAKLQDRKEKRQLRYQERKNKRKSKKGYGGFIAAIISLSCAVLILGGLLTFSIFKPVDVYEGYSPKNEQSFYGLVDCVDNMDVNLSKFMVSNDDEERQKLLNSVSVQSNIATENLSSLAIQDENKFYTIKFINQTGDYAKYLSNKLIDGEKLTSKDIETINTIYEINKNLKSSLQELSSKISSDFDFDNIYDDRENNILLSTFSGLEKLAIEYPHMIYDGAFADSVKQQEAKGLKDYKEIDKKTAMSNFEKYFKKYNVSDTKIIGELNNEVLPCYNLEAVDSNGVKISANISKIGGKLISYNYYKDCNATNYGLEECKVVADKFLKDLGYENMDAVWSVEDGNVVTFNYVYKQDGVVYYPDMVKVNVCRERNVVSGIEAKSYYLNHTKRTTKKASVSKENASKKINSELVVTNSKLAVIPKTDGTEILTYEFICNYNEDTFYIYLDANTGKEINIYKVVKTNEGTLLI